MPPNDLDRMLKRLGTLIAALGGMGVLVFILSGFLLWRLFLYANQCGALQ